MEYNIKKILVPIDFSEFSRNSLRYAASFAERFNAQLILVYVIEPVIYPPDFSMGQIAIPALDSEMDKRALDELETLARNEVKSDIKVSCIIKTGKPFYEIVQTASEEDADLIIISSHGHTGVEHILFGSTAEKVVRKAPCPVLSLREPLKGYQYKSAVTEKKEN